MLDVPVFHLDVSTPGSEDAVVIAAAGELDISTVRQLTKAVRDAASAEADAVVLDLRDLTFIDAVGVGALVDAKVMCAAAGHSLVLRSPHPRVLAVLAVLELDAAFRLESSAT